MRQSCLLLLASMLALAVAPFPQPSATASCAAPYLKDAEGLVLQRGETVTVEGRAFVDGCRDSGSCTAGLGCDSCDYGPPETPMEDVPLRLAQRDRSWDLALADARTATEDELGWVTWTFRVPAGVQPGRAKLVADQSEPVQVQVR